MNKTCTQEICNKKKRQEKSVCSMHRAYHEKGQVLRAQRVCKIFINITTLLLRVRWPIPQFYFIMWYVMVVARERTKRVTWHIAQLHNIFGLNTMDHNFILCIIFSIWWRNLENWFKVQGGSNDVKIGTDFCKHLLYDFCFI